MKILTAIKKTIRSVQQDGLKETGKLLSYHIKVRIGPYILRAFPQMRNDIVNQLRNDIVNEISGRADWYETLNIPYSHVYNKLTFSEDLLEQQRKDIFPRNITFSIIVPLYNTPEKFLRPMIESVQAQTYDKWELCLADGSDAEHDFVGKISRKYAENDQRIHYKKLEKNYGISGNTNECLQMSTGDYIGLLDHDDILHPAALHEVMKAICDGNADFIYTDEAIFTEKPQDAYRAHFKPDYAPDNLLSNNYICHFSVFSRTILESVVGFRSEYDGSQDHDFILRATEIAACIAHIPEALYYWRDQPNSVASSDASLIKPYAVIAGQKAVKDHITRLGRNGTVTSTKACSTIYKINYSLENHPKISIIIPNYEHYDDLRNCIDSIFNKTTYDNFEIVIVENNSNSDEIFDYYQNIQQSHNNVKVVNYANNFNFSSICNYGAKQSFGEILLFLNNDTEVITKDWLEEMLMFAQRKDVGAVGAKLYYPNDTIQHAGILLGGSGIAGHYFCGAGKNNAGYIGRLCYAQDQTAVTGACLMVRKEVFNIVQGFTEDFSIAYNDVDFCLKLRENGYLNVWTPYAELYHYESKSRGLDFDNKGEKASRLTKESELFIKRWTKEIDYGDPYYNANLVYPHFSIGPVYFQYQSIILPHTARFTRKQ